MNEELHWNTIAQSYNKEIFDVFASDKNKLLPKYFKKHRNPKATALDFGCGNGKAFPLIAPGFKELVAADISEELLNQARKSRYKNISFLHEDLAKPKVNLPPVDFIFSCNVIMLPEIDKNYLMLQNIQRALRPGGSALLVLPSTESIFFAAWRLIDWYKKEGVSANDIDPSELSYFKGGKEEILQGIFYIDGVATKHYALPELEVILKSAGLKITATEKLEYDWNTEFDSPPAWMKDPYPWDWLLECKRVK
jgi:SAM-dependent methyltransferase